MKNRLYKHKTMIIVKHLILFLIVLVFQNTILFSQIKNEKSKQYKLKNNFIIKTNPLTMIGGSIPLTSEFRIVFESAISRNQSLQIGASYLGKSPILYYYEKNDSSYIKNNIKFVVYGFRIQLSYKFYITNKLFNCYAPKGLYVSPLFSYSSANFTDKYNKTFNNYINATYINYNLIFGYQNTIKDKFVYDLFAGGGYRQNKWYRHVSQSYKSLDDDGLYLLNRNLNIILGFNIGWMF